MINAFDPRAANGLTERERDMVADRDRLLGAAYRLFYRTPVHFVRGEGVWLFDPQGNAYLDVYNNVASVGHCHPRVVEALSAQARTLNTHTRYLNEKILEYAERLLARVPPELENIIFTCSGSEANDLALRMAKATTGARGIIVTDFAYHGVTDMVSEVSPSLGPAVAESQCVRHVSPPNPYRGDAMEFVRDVQAAIADLRKHGIAPAALLVDTIFSSDGIFPAANAALEAAAAAVREAGGLFIADEVQPGFYRTGTHMWGFERHGVVPDLVTLGKPMGNGHPIAAVIARRPIVEAFGGKQRYFNTFGGNPVSCAVGLAVLDVLEKEKLAENAAAIGNHLMGKLKGLLVQRELIGDVRGAGLFIGVELVKDRKSREPATEAATQIVNALCERRVLISATGRYGNVLKIRPPLVFSQSNADLFIAKLDECLADSEAQKLR